MELQVPQIGSTIFTHNRREKTLTAEHSDTGNVSFSSPLYDDACDVGIQVYNRENGNLTRWYLAEQERDAEGDLIQTIFLPCEESIRKYPACKDYKIILFND